MMSLCETLKGDEMEAVYVLDVTCTVYGKQKN